MNILFSEEFDVSTTDVVKWMIYYKQPFIRYNDNKAERLNYVHIDINADQIDLSNSLSESFHFNRMSGCKLWYRRSHMKMAEQPTVKGVKKIADALNKFLVYENNVIEWYIQHSLLSYSSLNINRPPDFSVNKLIVLKYALWAGLSIPETIVTTSKAKLVTFKSTHKRIITKPISEVMTIPHKNSVYQMFTEEVNDEMINSLKETFAPMLFQNRIDKLYEVRTFVYKDVLYSMAIFSQSIIQTQTDFRKYSKSKPNRTVPYKLPDNIEEMVLKLMKKMGYNSGSVDFIVDKQFNHYFLEVNPVGQFGMVSYPCNYFIEKEIAKDLM